MVPGLRALGGFSSRNSRLERVAHGGVSGETKRTHRLPRGNQGESSKHLSGTRSDSIKEMTASDSMTEYLTKSTNLTNLRALGSGMRCRAEAKKGTLEYDLEEREKAMKGKRGKPKDGRAWRTLKAVEVVLVRLCQTREVKTCGTGFNLQHCVKNALCWFQPRHSTHFALSFLQLNGRL